MLLPAKREFCDLMQIDLIGVILLLWGMTLGSPTTWQLDASVRLAVDSSGTPSLEVMLDPWITVEDASIPRCGLTVGWVMILHGNEPCLAHETLHIRQRQAWGLAFAAAYALDPTPWEDYLGGSMLVPRGLNYPLIRLSVPLRWDSCSTMNGGELCRPRFP